MKRFLTLVGALALFAGMAGAQPVITTPSPLRSTVYSSSVAVTNTFQSLQVATLGGGPYRLGCLIQNKGANSMWVFFGPIASATKNLSYILVTGAPPISCATLTGGVLQDQVSVTGTAGDLFAATFQ